MLNRKFLFVFLPVLLLVPNAALAQTSYCRNYVEIDSDGETEHTILWTVSPGRGYYYPRGGTWGLTIPGGSNQINVTHNGESLYHEIDERGRNTWIEMENHKEVDGDENYTFEISYKKPRGLIKYRNTSYFSSFFNTGCSEENKITINFPEKLDLIGSTKEYESIEGGVEIKEIKTYEDYEDVELTFETGEKLNELKSFEVENFNITAPETYEDFIYDQAEEVSDWDQYFEDLAGLKSPGRVNLTYLEPNSSELDGVWGHYRNGEINIDAGILAGSRLDSLSTLAHETVHAHNSEMYSDPTTWWWEEGVAEYVSYNTLEKNNYNVSAFKRSEETIENTFEHCDIERNFISNWGRDYSYSISMPIICDFGVDVDVITDRDQLAYQYGRIIIGKLSDKEPDIVSSVHQKMTDKRVKFSRVLNRRNNQINFFASQVTDEDLTSFFHDHGIDAESWKDDWNTINTAKEDIEEYEEDTRHEVFTGILGELNKSYGTFYEGYFDEAADDSDNILETAEDIEHIHESYLVEVEDRIDELKERYNENLFVESSNHLQEAIESLRDVETRKGEQLIENANETATHREEEILEYKSSEEELENKIESKNILTEPFLLGADSNLQTARELYNEGSLQEAKEEVETGLSKSKIATPLALITYASIIFLVLYFLFKKNYLNKLRR